MAPVIAATSIKVLDMLEESQERRFKVHENTSYFRKQIKKLGFELLDGKHPIVPIMLRDPNLCQQMAESLSQKGVYVAPFSFPVVPRGTDRIRTQMSAALSIKDLDFAILAFHEAGKEIGII